ncbi:hypothetical protein ACJJTC_017587 [Scirpophaga incertulas]
MRLPGRIDSLSIYTRSKVRPPIYNNGKGKRIDHRNRAGAIRATRSFAARHPPGSGRDRRRRSVGQSGPSANYPTSAHSDGNAITPAQTTHDTRSILSCSNRTSSSRSSATIRAQKLALEAEALRRQIERERELERAQAERGSSASGT